jgi:hypothetical protein
MPCPQLGSAGPLLRHPGPRAGIPLVLSLRRRRTRHARKAAGSRLGGNSGLDKLPSFYWDQNIYGSFIHDAVGIATRHLPGAKNIMWSSDYPHSETTFPDSHAMIERIFAGVPEEEKRAILGGRAEGFSVGVRSRE